MGLGIEAHFDGPQPPQAGVCHPERAARRLQEACEVAGPSPPLGRLVR
jgi:hypothetical protein